MEAERRGSGVGGCDVPVPSRSFASVFPWTGSSSSPSPPTWPARSRSPRRCSGRGGPRPPWRDGSTKGLGPGRWRQGGQVTALEPAIYDCVLDVVEEIVDERADLEVGRTGLDAGVLELYLKGRISRAELGCTYICSAGSSGVAVNAMIFVACPTGPAMKWRIWISAFVVAIQVSSSAVAAAVESRSRCLSVLARRLRTARGSSAGSRAWYGCTRSMSVRSSPSIPRMWCRARTLNSDSSVKIGNWVLPRLRKRGGLSS